MGDSVDAILGCGILLKNAVGMVGVIIIIGICIMPIIKLATFSIMYSLTSSIIEPIADGKIVKEGAQIILGSNESYVALCRKHYKEGKLWR